MKLICDYKNKRFLVDVHQSIKTEDVTTTYKERKILLNYIAHDPTDYMGQPVFVPNLSHKFDVMTKWTDVLGNIILAELIEVSDTLGNLKSVTKIDYVNDLYNLYTDYWYRNINGACIYLESRFTPNAYILSCADLIIKKTFLYDNEHKAEKEIFYQVFNYHLLKKDVNIKMIKYEN